MDLGSPFVIVYAWVMGCTTITGKEYLPLGRRSSRIMPRAINFFSLSLFSPSHHLSPLSSPIRGREVSSLSHRRLFSDGICFLPLHSISFPSDISMVKSNFSPLDSHRLTYGQHSGGGLNVFLSNFNPFAGS